MINISNHWKTTYPGATVGILIIRNVTNPGSHPLLEQRKKDLENQLRNQYAALDHSAIEALPPLQAYQSYYKQFKKSYHVQLQLESIVYKGKNIPSVASLVEAMFMAELQNMLLTAGHDFNAVHSPIELDVATGNENYTLLNGKEQILKEGDMMMRDGKGIISSVIYGPDQRTRILPDTQQVLFTVYAPAGISEQAVIQHLNTLRDNVSLVCPACKVELLQSLHG